MRNFDDRNNITNIINCIIQLVNEINNKINDENTTEERRIFLTEHLIDVSRKLDDFINSNLIDHRPRIG